MKLVYIELYNDILVELESLLTLEYTRNIVKEYMAEIKKESLKQAKEFNIDENIAKNLFNNKKSSAKQLFAAGIKIRIPNKLQESFGGYRKGYLKYYYDPVRAYNLKNKQLDKILKELVKFKNNYSKINIDNLVAAIDIEKGYTKYFLEDECEYMQIECGNKKDKVIFDVYDRKDIKLPKQDIQNHIRLVGNEVISDIKFTNFFSLYSNQEIKEMLEDMSNYRKNNNYYKDMKLIYKK